MPWASRNTSPPARAAASPPARTSRRSPTTSPRSRSIKGHEQTGGRNTYGRITTRHRGGGHKRRYRIIDFKRRKDGVPAKVAAIEYDPNRTARIALLHYADGEKRYILAPQRLQGRRRLCQSGQAPRSSAGNSLPLRNIPAGTTVHNVELQPGRGGQLGRSAGAAIQLVAKEGDYATLRLPSGEMRLVHVDCRATIGAVGNADHENITIGKAGRNRWMGKRPQTRGVGHEPGRPPARRRRGQDAAAATRSRPGASRRGYRTRKKNKPSDQFIVRGRKRGKGRSAKMGRSA